MLGNTFAAKQNSKPPTKEIPPKVGLYIIFQCTVTVYDSMAYAMNQSIKAANVCYSTICILLISRS
jgi:hypothetical protein